MTSKLKQSLSLAVTLLTPMMGSFLAPYAAAAAMTRPQAGQQGIGYTTGPACTQLRRQMAESFAAKNRELFNLKEDLRFINVNESQKGSGAIGVDSVVVASFEQKSGGVIETVEIHFQGRKNFECDDFTASDVTVQVVDFRLQ